MSAATRAWLAFPAVGAGLIHLSLALAAPLPLSLLLGVWGAAEFFWGVFAFALDRVPVPRVALVAAVAPTILWGISVALGFGPPVSLVAMTGACLLELVVAVGLARHLRAVAPGARSPSGRGNALGVLAAVAVVVVITGGSIGVASTVPDLPATPPSHGH